VSGRGGNCTTYVYVVYHFHEPGERRILLPRLTQTVQYFTIPVLHAVPLSLTVRPTEALFCTRTAIPHRLRKPCSVLARQYLTDYRIFVTYFSKLRYAAGATIQVLLFGVLAINLKKVAPSAHTVAEIVNARWGTRAHLTFLFFCFCANILVTSMLLLGGAATVEALTGMDYRLASFLIPWGVILYTASGGLQATFLASYIHTVIIFAVLITMIFLVYVKFYSSDQIYEFLNATTSYTDDQCESIFSDPLTNITFFEKGKYACGPVPGNDSGSYLTMISADGLMFGIINIVGNFGTVFVDQSYWQSAIAAKPSSAARGYLLGG
jgi:Na+/proline symporter